MKIAMCLAAAVLTVGTVFTGVLELLIPVFLLVGIAILELDEVR